MSRRSEKSYEGTCLLSKLCHANGCGCVRGERSSTSSDILKTGLTSKRSYDKSVICAGPGLFTPRCFEGNCSVTEAEELSNQSIYSCFKKLDRLSHAVINH
nr:uncharacterized protein LOC118681309 [Bactrocera oleae]